MGSLNTASKYFSEPTAKFDAEFGTKLDDCSVRTSRPVPFFFSDFLAAAKKDALNKGVITLDETKHFFAAAVRPQKMH